MNKITCICLGVKDMERSIVPDFMSCHATDFFACR